MGKLLERVIYKRLLPAVERWNCFSDMHYGFRPPIFMMLIKAKTPVEGTGAKKKECIIITLDISKVNMEPKKIEFQYIYVRY